jgi:hypothetical protein
MMVWQDWSNLNKKYNDAWLAGLGGLRGLGAMGGGDIELLQTLINGELEDRQQPLLTVTSVWDAPTCDALTALLQEYAAATPAPPQASTAGWIIDIWNANQQEILAACETVAGQVQTTTPTTPSTTPAPSTTPGATVPMAACTAAGCDCYVYEGDVGPHITDLQQQLNAALDAHGYEGIVATGVYDKETCGAIFELGGSFRPDFPGTHCSTDMTQEWLIPLECPDMVLPKKKGAAPNGGGMSRAGMFAVGGLVLAAGLGAAYWVAQR